MNRAERINNIIEIRHKIRWMEINDMIIRENRREYNKMNALLRMRRIRNILKKDELC
jgi:hypothetical protein